MNVRVIAAFWRLVEATVCKTLGHQHVVSRYFISCKRCGATF